MFSRSSTSSRTNRYHGRQEPRSWSRESINHLGEPPLQRRRDGISQMERIHAHPGPGGIGRMTVRQRPDSIGYGGLGGISTFSPINDPFPPPYHVPRPSGPRIQPIDNPFDSIHPVVPPFLVQGPEIYSHHLYEQPYPEYLPFPPRFPYNSFQGGIQTPPNSPICMSGGLGPGPRPGPVPGMGVGGGAGEMGGGIHPRIIERGRMPYGPLHSQGIYDIGTHPPTPHPRTPHPLTPHPLTPNISTASIPYTPLTGGPRAYRAPYVEDDPSDLEAEILQQQQIAMEQLLQQQQQAAMSPVLGAGVYYTPTTGAGMGIGGSGMATENLYPTTANSNMGLAGMTMNGLQDLGNHRRYEGRGGRDDDRDRDRGMDRGRERGRNRSFERGSAGGVRDGDSGAGRRRPEMVERGRERRRGDGFHRFGILP